VPERDRQIDELAHVVQALPLVGVEQLIGRAAQEHEIELPGERGRVAHACADPLRRERRQLVRGVTGQKHVPACARSLPSARGSGRTVWRSRIVFDSYSPHRASNSHAMRESLSDSIVSCGRRKNSKRRRPGRPK